MLWEKKRKLIFCFSLCYHGQAWKQRSFHWCLHAVSSDKKKKGKEGKACSIHWGNEFRSLYSCARHINISGTKMESDVKTTTLALGPWIFGCNCKARLQMGCSSVSHMYARTRIWAGLRQHQTAFDLAHPFSANKTPKNQHSPIIFDFIVSKI